MSNIIARQSIKIIKIEIKIILNFDILIIESSLLPLLESADRVVIEVLVPNRCWNDGLILNNYD